MKQVGIIGGAGYTAGELIRILLNHKEVAIKYIFSTSNAGNKVSAVHQDLVGDTDLIFSGNINTNVDVLFLCLGHGNSKDFLVKTAISSSTKVIDLSSDFRLKNNAIFQGREFVYGHAARAPPPPHFVDRRFGACVCCSCWRCAKR